MKNNMSTYLLILILLLGLSLLLYPTISEYWNSLHSSQAIAGYSEKVAIELIALSRLTSHDHE